MPEDLEVLLYGNPRLRVNCLAVDSFDEDLRELVRGMERAMILERGIGLAAPQVGDRRRVLLLEDSRSGRTTTLALINPEITELSREKEVFNEGCLSLPELYVDIRRPVGVRVRYQDLEGVEHELHDDGIVARVVQHEIDHLEGILFVDHLPVLRRKLLTRKLRELQARAREQMERGL